MHDLINILAVIQVITVVLIVAPVWLTLSIKARLKLRRDSPDTARPWWIKRNYEQERSFWSKPQSNTAAIVVAITSPLLAIVLISRYRIKALEKRRVAMGLLASSFAWLLVFSAWIRVPAKYQHPQYEHQIVTAPIDESAVETQDISIPEVQENSESPDNQPQNDNTAPQASSGGDTPQAGSSGDQGPMAGIVAAEAEQVPYNRNAYQPNWSVGGGCDIRSRILTSVSLAGVSYGTNGCTVTHGSWLDPYTGQTLTGNPYRGDGTANDLDIDHIIPLNYVNSHGGYHWPDSSKRAYGASLAGVNNGVYLAVSASENRKKGDKGPSNYYPPNPSYRCEYSKKWRDIARIYKISLAINDFNLILSTLNSCGIG